MTGMRVFVVGMVVFASLAIGWWIGQRGASAPGDSPAGVESKAGGHAAGGQREPLYWVAPMDPNYRSDRPGKSPMGMDLVAVYADDAAVDSAGGVRVSPDVQHNLGVRLAPVLRGVLETPLRSVGFVGFDEARVRHIHTRVEGWVQSLAVNDAGEPVAKGQELFTLYSPALIKAQEDYLLGRTGTLAGAGSLGDRSLGGTSLRGASRDRLLALGMSREQISRIEKQGAADQNVAVVADRDGVVGRLNVREGMYVRPDLEVMSIGNLDEVWVSVELFERESVFVEQGQDVVMQLDYLPGRRWRAKVGYVYPVLDVATRTVRVRMVLDNSDGLLKPGMFGEVTIYTRSNQDVLTIPREALIRGMPADRVVLALGDARFRSQAVTAGREAGGRVEIVAGLEEGMQVVTSGQFLIDSESSRNADLVRLDPQDVDEADSDNGVQKRPHQHD